MTTLNKIQGPRTLNDKINDRGNMELHRMAQTRKSVWVSNAHLTKKTHQTLNFCAFY